jgi:hypothetical protein
MIYRFPMSCDCDTRCSSRIAHESGVVLRCQRPVHVDDQHRTLHEAWLDGDKHSVGTSEVTDGR